MVFQVIKRIRVIKEQGQADSYDNLKVLLQGTLNEFELWNVNGIISPIYENNIQIIRGYIDFLNVQENYSDDLKRALLTNLLDQVFRRLILNRWKLGKLFGDRDLEKLLRAHLAVECPGIDGVLDPYMAERHESQDYRTQVGSALVARNIPPPENFDTENVIAQLKPWWLFQIDYVFIDGADTQAFKDALSRCSTVDDLYDFILTMCVPLADSTQIRSRHGLCLFVRRLIENAPLSLLRQKIIHGLFYVGMQAHVTRSMLVRDVVEVEPNLEQLRAQIPVVQDIPIIIMNRPGNILEREDNIRRCDTYREFADSVKRSTDIYIVLKGEVVNPERLALAKRVQAYIRFLDARDNYSDSFKKRLLINMMDFEVHKLAEQNFCYGDLYGLLEKHVRTQCYIRKRNYHARRKQKYRYKTPAGEFLSGSYIGYGNTFPEEDVIDALKPFLLMCMDEIKLPEITLLPLKVALQNCRTTDELIEFIKNDYLALFVASPWDPDIYYPIGNVVRQIVENVRMTEAEVQSIMSLYHCYFEPGFGVLDGLVTSNFLREVPYVRSAPSRAVNVESRQEHHAAYRAVMPNELSIEEGLLAFYDPTSGKLMQDPVIVTQSGLTIDRATYDAWMKSELKTVPGTDDKLLFIPRNNYSLKKAIRHFFRGELNLLEDALTDPVDFELFSDPVVATVLDSVSLNRETYTGCMEHNNKHPISREIFVTSAIPNHALAAAVDEYNDKKEQIEVHFEEMALPCRRGETTYRNLGALLTESGPSDKPSLFPSDDEQVFRKVHRDELEATADPLKAAVASAVVKLGNAPAAA